jgi:hypothetical protein
MKSHDDYPSLPLRATHKQRLLAILIFSIGLAAILGSACARPQVTTVPPSAPTKEVVKGYGISPLGFPDDYSRFSDFLQEIGKLPNGGVMFNGSWREDAEGGSDAGKIPATAAALMQQASADHYTPIIVFGWRSDDKLLLSVPGDPANDWTNVEAQDLFAQMLVNFASQYHPPYLFLGNESEAYFITSPDDYARWVDFYNRAYDAVKAVSPETQIGPVFQYERLSGQGNFNHWTTPHWGALEAHDLSKVDIVGLTVYPWLGVATPQEIPADYFAPLLERIGDKRVAITETGWPGENLGLDTAWEQSPQAQLDYVTVLDRVLNGMNLKILNWLHYYQMVPTDGNASFWKTFSSISLIDYEGNKRPVYDAWINFEP